LALTYNFSTTTTDSDPGNGNLRLDNATQTAATTIYADLQDNLGVDWTAALDTIDASTNSVKGYIWLALVSDLSKWILFSISARTTATGYRKFTVTEVAASGASPIFSDTQAIAFSFVPNGNTGDTGPSG
jgi:hypothetical protein